MSHEPKKAGRLCLTSFVLFFGYPSNPLIISSCVLCYSRGKQYLTQVLKNALRCKTDKIFTFNDGGCINRGCYTVARRYEFYSLVRYCSCHDNIKLISSSYKRVMFFSLYRAEYSWWRRFWRFSQDYRALTKDCRRLSRKTRRCFDCTPTNFKGVLSRYLATL